MDRLEPSLWAACGQNDLGIWEMLYQVLPEEGERIVNTTPSFSLGQEVFPVLEIYIYILPYAE